jgi:hypothetical protein
MLSRADVVAIGPDAKRNRCHDPALCIAAYAACASARAGAHFPPDTERAVLAMLDPMQGVMLDGVRAVPRTRNA